METTLLKVAGNCCALNRPQIGIWRAAAEGQSQLNYTEPPDWYYQVRESLGAAFTGDRKSERSRRGFSGRFAKKPGESAITFRIGKKASPCNSVKLTPDRCNESFSLRGTMPTAT